MAEDGLEDGLEDDLEQDIVGTAIFGARNVYFRSKKTGKIYPLIWTQDGWYSPKLKMYLH